MHTVNVEAILHYITLTNYDIVNDTETTSNHITINMRTKYKKENTNNTIVYTKHRSYITLYNTHSLLYCNDT